MDATTTTRTRHASAGLAFVCRCGRIFDGPAALYEHHQQGHAAMQPVEPCPPQPHGSRLYSRAELRELLDLVVDGAPVKEAADALEMSVATATHHVARRGGAKYLRRNAHRAVAS